MYQTMKVHLFLSGVESTLKLLWDLQFTGLALHVLFIYQQDSYFRTGLLMIQNIHITKNLNLPVNNELIKYQKKQAD
jgi:hypothetical protein